MRIALNLLYLLPGVVGGTETYALSLLRALADLDRDSQYIVFLNRESAGLNIVEAPNIRRVVCPVRAASRGLRYVWEQLALPFQLRHHNADLVHSLGYVGPLLSRCPSVISLHDLNFMILRDATMSGGKRRVLGLFSSWSARVASQVITDSDFSRRQIIDKLRLRPDQVSTIHLGPGQFDVGSANISRESAQRRHGLTAPYLCAFAGTYVHKNIRRLLLAFERIAMEVPHSLVLIGRLPPDVDLTNHQQLLSAGRIRPLGYIPAPDALSILGNAELFVFPSTYEGFGLPVLEAQQLGVPVACSNAASLPEVAGEGAVFFDPTSIDDIVAATHRCLRDARLRQALTQKGYENVARFSWRRTALETHQVYQRVAAGKKRSGAGVAVEGPAKEHH